VHADKRRNTTEVGAGDDHCRKPVAEELLPAAKVIQPQAEAPNNAERLMPIDPARWKTGV
jgi:hypothetical protein